ncbi:MAG: hypothetical protein K6B54_03585 [Clostridia bacterium]|nr:hypothetical protein [Clostridia bacterium]
MFVYFGAVEVFPCVLLGILAPFMAVSFGRLLNKVPVLNKALTWVGLRTLPILLVHMVISTFVSKLFGISTKVMGQMGTRSGISALNLLITLAIIVAYRILWELFLKKVKSKKQQA